MTDQPLLSPSLDLQRRRVLAETELEIIREYSLALHSTRDVRTLFPLLYQFASRIMHSDASFIALYNAQNHSLLTPFRYDNGVDYSEPNPQPFQPSEGGPLEWIISHGQPLRFADFNNEIPERFPHAKIIAFGDEQERSRSWISVPMLIDREVKGIVNLQSYRQGIYGEREERVLMTLGSMLAIAVERSQLLSRLERWRAELSAPLIPVSDRLLILPLIGRLDHERLELVQRSLLPLVERRRIAYVLVDLTGVTHMPVEGGRQLERLVRAVQLLGSRCVVSGLSPDLARQLAMLNSRLLALPLVRDVEQAVARLGDLEGLR